VFKEGGDEAFTTTRAPPSLNTDQLKWVWGVTPQRGPGAEPLALTSLGKIRASVGCGA
jgi:hypothetical protein